MERDQAILDLSKEAVDTAIAEQQQSGVNLWACGGAIAASLLLLFDAWEKEPLNLTLVGLYIAGLAPIIDLIVGWTQQFASRLATANSRAFRRLHEYSHLRLATLWRGGMSVGLLYLSVVLSDHVSLLTTILGSAWHLFFGLVAVTTVWATGIPWVTKASREPALSITASIHVVMALFCAVVAYGYLSLAKIPQPGSSTAPIKIGLLSLLSAYLIYLLLLHIRRPWSVERLMMTRRQLILGRISALDAHRRIAGTILGFEGGDAILDRALDLRIDLAECEEQDARCALGIEELQKSLALMSTNWENYSADEREEWLELTDSETETASDRFEECTGWLSDLRNGLSSLDSEVVTVRKTTPVSFRRLELEINRALTDLRTRLTALEMNQAMRKNSLALLVEQRKIFTRAGLRVTPERGITK